MVLALASSARAADEQDQRALLTATLNQVDKGEVLVVLRDGDLLIATAALEQIGVRGFQGARETIAGMTFVSLNSLAPALTYVLDDRALIVRLTAGPELLETVRRDLGGGRPPGIEYRRDPSAFANYAVNIRGGSAYDLFTDAGISARGAFVGTTATLVSGQSPVRGLTSAVFDQPDRLRRTVVGDAFADGGLIGGGVLLAGVSIAREYSVDPYFIRYPTFSLSGAIVTPSTVEVYINDRLVQTQELAPGQFDLARLPVTNGQNDARLVIRDAFGGVREISQAYYLTTNVLAQGLQEYHYSVGAQRKDFGIDSWAYGSPAFMGRHRVGLTDQVTVGGRLEVTPDLISAGPNMTARTPMGEVELAAALSGGDGARGAAWSAAFVHVGRTAGAGVAVRGATRQYATVSLRPFEDRPKLDSNAYVSVQVGPRGSFTLQRRDVAAYLAADTSRTALTGSLRLHEKADVFFTGALNRGGVDASGREVFVGLNLRVVPNATATVSVERMAATTSVAGEIQRPLPVGTGWGYRFRAESGDRDVSTAAVQYQGSYGRYEVRRDTSNGNTGNIVSVSGSLVAMGGGLYASRAIQDGFALVRVPEVGGVRTYASNQEVGRTDRGGNVLVPNLLSYYGNLLNISDQDVPLDHTVGAVRRTIAPPYRGGALVVFPVERIQGLTGIIQLVAGGRVIMPSYGQLTLTAAGRTIVSPVGERGEFFLENVPPGRHPAELQYQTVSCSLTVEMPTSQVPVVNLGTITCTVAP